MKVGDAKELPYEDNSFDIVIAINTIHNLNKEDCAKALKEISRVAKKNSFITVDAFRNEEENIPKLFESLRNQNHEKNSVHIIFINVK